MSDTFDSSTARPNSPRAEHQPTGQHAGQHTGMFAGLIAGLVVALAGVGYLAVRNNQLTEQIAQMQDGTQAQIAKLSTATTSLLEERLQSVTQKIDAVKDTEEKTFSAVRQTRLQAQKQSQEWQNRLQEQQKEAADEIAQLKDTTNNSINAVSSDVSSVKTDVGGVRNDVSAVKTDLNATQTSLDKTTADLKRAMGDLGVMSGLIATNSKDLNALRALGERNYTEFDITRKEPGKKMDGVTITLKKADAGHNRYTIAVFADDKLVEKKDRTINEPVQLYINGNRLPYEIVVNQVKKDEIVGYLSTPKVSLARN